MSRCRSCGAEIIWAVTAYGNRIPVDAEPNANGNLRLVRRAADQWTALVVTAQVELFSEDDGTRHMPHHATCPQAREWRK